MQFLKLNERNRLEKAPKEEATHVHLTIDEYNQLKDFERTATNLQRILKEKSCSERNITNKKERSGYLILGYDTYNLKFNFDSSKTKMVRRLLLESPYEISINYNEVEEFIIKDMQKVILEELKADGIIYIDNIQDQNVADEIFRSQDNLLILGHVEMQRSGNWAARLYANYTPDIPKDLIKINENNKKNH